MTLLLELGDPGIYARSPAVKFKAGSPGCECCVPPCAQTQWDASTPTDWTNDGNWSAVNLGGAWDVWRTSTNGAIVLLNQTWTAAEAPQIRFRFATASGATWPNGSKYRLLFWYVDSSNYWALEVHNDNTSRLGQILKLIQCVSGTESVIETRDAVQYNGDYTLCLKSSRVLLGYDDPAAWSSGTVGGGLCWVDLTPPSGSWQVGFQVVSTAENVWVSYLKRYCTACVKICAACTEDVDGVGPDQLQVVVSGYTGACAVYNGTYVVDRANSACVWYSDYGTGGGAPYARYVQVFLNGSATNVQLHHAWNTEYVSLSGVPVGGSPASFFNSCSDFGYYRIPHSGGFGGTCPTSSGRFTGVAAVTPT